MFDEADGLRLLDGVGSWHQNIFADALSRNPVMQPEELDVQESDENFRHVPLLMPKRLSVRSDWKKLKCCSVGP